MTVKPVSKHCQRSSLDPSYPLFAHQPMLGEQAAWYQKTLLHCHCFSLRCKEISSQKSCLQAFHCSFLPPNSKQCLIPVSS